MSLISVLKKLCYTLCSNSLPNKKAKCYTMLKWRFVVFVEKIMNCMINWIELLCASNKSLQMKDLSDAKFILFLVI